MYLFGHVANLLIRSRAATGDYAQQVGKMRALGYFRAKESVLNLLVEIPEEPKFKRTEVNVLQLIAPIFIMLIGGKLDPWIGRILIYLFILYSLILKKVPRYYFIAYALWPILALLRLEHWSISHEMLFVTWGASVLALLISAFTHYKKLNERLILFAISLVISTILAKAEHWPSAQIMAYIAATSLAIAYSLRFSKKPIKNLEDYSKLALVLSCCLILVGHEFLKNNYLVFLVPLPLLAFIIVRTKNLWQERRMKKLL